MTATRFFNGGLFVPLAYSPAIATAKGTTYVHE